ncbi:hypothetical protein [Pseudomonas sp. BNK-30]|uniref:hypothetical protein n=1 Tax=Pseudomonas sp. BNK-30 TaxID=3376165 RepID=UPI0039BF83D4
MMAYLQGDVMLNCANVRIADIAAPSLLNKKRKAKGKPLFFNNHLLRLRRLEAVRTLREIFTLLLRASASRGGGSCTWVDRPAVKSRKTPAHASVPTRTATIKLRLSVGFTVPACQSCIVDEQRHAETGAQLQWTRRKKAQCEYVWEMGYKDEGKSDFLVFPALKMWVF